ncbi:hypothetical protein B0J12DRAFT_703314 [Macrophomina phaseolina]|uniref:Uncharacterized protein n=1 Tax=Macrophomina phaseolina TaxID=35725 RepID=A0ABQ8FZ51_9PEZI|nr:hypothetical protein B0J12DRAFT_703314 [Macrophomina phaseolina]
MAERAESMDKRIETVAEVQLRPIGRAKPRRGRYVSIAEADRLRRLCWERVERLAASCKLLARRKGTPLSGPCWSRDALQQQTIVARVTKALLRTQAVGDANGVCVRSITPTLLSIAMICVTEWAFSSL